MKKTTSNLIEILMKSTSKEIIDKQEAEREIMRKKANAFEKKNTVLLKPLIDLVKKHNIAFRIEVTRGVVKLTLSHVCPDMHLQFIADIESYPNNPYRYQYKSSFQAGDHFKNYRVENFAQMVKDFTTEILKNKSALNDKIRNLIS